MDTWFTDDAGYDAEASSRVDLKIVGISGDVCTVCAKRADTVLDVKEEIAAATGMPCKELILLLQGDCEVYNDERLDAVVAQKSSLTLTLLRRPEEASDWIQLVRVKGRRLSKAPVHIQADRGVVLCAVKRHGLALSYAAPELKADRGVVLAAVSRNGLALEYAENGLKADREVVLTAVRQCGLALEYVSDALRSDREVVLAAVQEGGTSALRYAPEHLRGDPEIFVAIGFGR
eukprot:TRINITY_DN40065_c0_g1_i1.p1 TRINITY_DN40065_c0_g1~~TRINITY_DN40065_c0_g1_i1.p1  ORF type:complete len:233 (-),score=50.50 TRINITY_DN40065_c0_g1_i1:446-1144(-)